MRPDKPTLCFRSSGLFVLLALLWLPLQAANAALSENGSRIADATRTALVAIDTDYTLTSNSQLIVYAAGVNDPTECRLRSGEGGHSPQYRVLSGSWANVPTSNGSGPYLEASGTALTNDSSVSSGERLANLSGTGSYIAGAKEFTTSTNLDYSSQIREDRGEAQWAMNFSTSPDNTTYEFRVRWGTKDCGNQYVTYSAWITTSTSEPPEPHFSISHDGSADLTLAENITIALHDGSHSVDTDYIGTVTLSTSTSNGDWSLVSGSGTLNNSGNGDATYTYVDADNGSVVLGLLNTIAEIVNINLTDGTYSEDDGEDADLSFAGLHWGRDEQNPSLYTTSNSRSMGGTSPDTDDMQITEIGIYLGAQTGSIRLGVYTGGSLDDPASATLLWDAGTVTGTGTAGWFTVSTGGVSWPKNTPTWLGWKHNTGVGIYYSDSSADAGDFQTARGRNVNSFSQDPGVAFPATYGETGTFGNYWYSIYVGYQVVSGSGHFSISHDGSANTCDAESITIVHHDDSHSVDTSYTGTITLSTTTTNGDWSLVTGSGTLNNSGSGSATYTYDAADNGSVVLGLLNTNMETLNIGVTDGTDSEDSGEDADLVFGGTTSTIAKEQTITGSASSSPSSLASISGGSDQTYVLFVATDDNKDVTAVSGGGLTWTLREEQCGTNNKSRIEAWTAQGSPSSFQVSVTWDDSRPMAAVLSRYSGVDGFGDTSSANPDGVNGSCSVDDKSNPARISLTSTIDGAVHVIGTNASDKSINTPIAQYATVGVSGSTSDGTTIGVFDRSLSPAGANTFLATLNGPTYWASAGIVLEPSTAPAACGGINHFAIAHDGYGINCQVEPVTLTAHNSGHTAVSAYTGVASLSTSTSRGDWSIIMGAGTLDNATADDGVATYSYDAADSGSVTLGLSDTYAETVNIDVTDGSAIEDASEDADLVFASSGFNFLADSSKNSIGTQIGGKASDVAPGAQTLELEAVQTNDDTGACEAALTGVNSVELAFECENPGACTARQVSISGTDIAGNPFGSVSSYTSVSLDFGDATDTTATFTLSYPDVGQLQLHARRTLAPSGETMLGASNSFVVRPFALHVAASGNPAASSPAGSVFTNAGVNFTTTVNAVLWSSLDDTNFDGVADNHDDTDPSNNADLSDNVVALNYGQESAVESVTLTATLDQPSGGTDPGLSGGTTVAAFSAGSGSSTTTRFDEVGIIEMSAAIADGDYLGIGAPATAAIVGMSGYVGRFNPARYAVTASNIVAACSSTFTYARQPFSGSLTLEAQNGAAGGNLRTSNYRSGFVTLDPATELTVVNNQTAGSYDLQNIAFSQDFDTGTTGQAVLALQFRWDMALQAPVTSIAQVTGVTDEVTVIGGAPIDIGFTPMRYGRVALGNAIGSELVNLAVPMRTQYFLSASADFVTSTDDFCSSAVTLSFSDFADNLTSGDTCVIDTGSPGVSAAGCVVPGSMAQRFDAPPIAGDFNLFLQAPGDGNDGSVTVDADVPDWLKFDWDTAAPGDENPSGRVTFGIYDGSDRQIYRRELY